MSWRDSPRHRRLPFDDQWYDIEVYPMMIDWSGKPEPRSPRGTVRVKALDDDNFQHAHDEAGWIYIRYGQGWGWTTYDSHLSVTLGIAFATLAGKWHPDPREAL